MSTLAPPRVEPVADDRAYISRVPYLPGLDGMRALAVVAVMVYHANSDWLPGGFLGVEMFFVISGYLITLLLISERERTYRISLRHFWMRRARRLLPALFTMMFDRHRVDGALQGARPSASCAATCIAGTSTCRTGTRSGSARDTPPPATSRRCGTCGAWRSRSSSTSSGRW
jgi:hypothetical protein